MKLSSRERFLIGVLFTIIIWAVALEVFIRDASNTGSLWS
jgi:TRAP-type C4-dicarboxylate transport system permease small subunit